MIKNNFIIGFLFSRILLSQDYEVKGFVFFNDKPVFGASIYINNSNKGSISNKDGFFIINNLEITHNELIISHTGFISKKINLDFSKKIQINLEKLNLISNESLNEIVISGTLKPVSKLNSPVPIEVYNKKFFKSNPTPSIFESLQNINGVRPQLNCSVCNTGDIHINGQEGSYTMVLVDGLPIVSGLSSVYGLTGIPQSLIEQIEVVKGPTSTIYGSEAIGGLINLITKLPEHSDKFSFDSFTTGWREVNSDFGYRYNIGKSINSLLGINYFNYSNPIDNNKDGFTDLTLQDRVSIFHKIDFNNKISIATRYIYEDRWGGQMNWNSNYRASNKIYGESIYTSRWEVFGKWDYNKNLKLQFSLNDHNQNSVYGTTRYDANQTIGFVQILYNKLLRSNDLTFGLAYRYTFYDDNSTATFNESDLFNDPDKVHLPGIFVQNEIKLSSQNSFLFGLRSDYNSVYGNIITPRINYKWNSIDKSSTIRLGLGSGYRITNVFTEDHASLTGARDVVFKEDLKPEKSWNINLNYVESFFLKPGVIIDFDSSFFITKFSNKIIPDYDFDLSKIIYQNLKGSSISKGGSFNINSTFSNGLRINLGGTFIDSYKIENGLKEKPYLTETFQGVWRVSYKIYKKNLTIDYTGNAIGPMLLPLLGPLDPRPRYSPFHSIQNIQLTKTISNKYEFYFGIKNILNFTPDKRSIARSFDPFDKYVSYDGEGNIIADSQNPYGLKFDPSYVYASNQGIRWFLGIRVNVN
ncbi:MAG: TonB-dependent receptor [Flavobacteriaceae bacterium]|nr:TonB-dependent receptor [Flavobacteriaceae bacterium]